MAAGLCICEVVWMASPWISTSCYVHDLPESAENDIKRVVDEYKILYLWFVNLYWDTGSPPIGSSPLESGHPETWVGATFLRTVSYYAHRAVYAAAKQHGSGVKPDYARSTARFGAAHVTMVPDGDDSTLKLRSLGDGVRVDIPVTLDSRYHRLDRTKQRANVYNIDLTYVEFLFWRGKPSGWSPK